MKHSEIEDARTPFFEVFMMMLINQFLYDFLGAVLRIVSSLLLDPINSFCLIFLFLNTLGYILILTAIARISRKSRSIGPNESPMKSDNAKPKCSSLPTISFIIPTHNEEETIERKLKNTRSLNYPKDRLEVIVVDDGSTDKTSSIIAEVQRMWFPKLRIITQSRKGKSSAENTGLQNSKGEIIVISDADVPLNPNALRFMIEDFKDQNVGGVTCSIQANREYVLALNLDLGLYTRKLENEIDSIFGLSGPFVSFRRQVMPKINEGIFSSDTDTGVIIRKRGYRVLYDPRIVSHVDRWVENKPRTVVGFLKKLKHMAFGNLYLFLRHKDVLLKSRYGLFGWIIAPRYLFLNVFAPIVFIVLSINLIITMIGSGFLVSFLFLIAFFLAICLISRKLASHSIVSKALYLVFMYIIRYYAALYYYLFFVLSPNQRRGIWNGV